MLPDIKWLDNPEVFRVNQLPAHSDHICYANKDEAVVGINSLRQCLNGTWKFSFSPNPGLRPNEFYKEGFDSSGFGSISVPGHIELAGYDQIQYVNIIYPWEGHELMRPPHTVCPENTGEGLFSESEYNPVGSYLTDFVLEKGLRNKSVSLVLEGVEQAVYIWLNGHFVGYAEDSFTPSEFDLTPYLKKTNKLAVQVFKRCTANYLEDQDFFRFFGIFRDVYLVAKPTNHLTDMWLRPSLFGDNKSGKLDVDLNFENVVLDGFFRFTISDSFGVNVHTGMVEIPKKEEENTAKININNLEFTNIIPWSNTNPILYQFELEICNDQGEVTEYMTYPFGFRRIEIVNKVILLNGKRHIINGVNRHEWNAKRGRAITEKDMKMDMEIIKGNYINSVRTSHYPNHIKWYYLCDQAGIYLMAETNMESHGTWQILGANMPVFNVPGNIPQWREVVVDRARTNFMTFRNHTSILFWSLGNESHAEENIRVMNEFFKENDSSRLVHYEGNFWNSEFEDSISDVKSRMYATPQEISAYLENNPQKPYVLCEYMHSMGNSLGGIKTYMELLDKYEMYQGGYIWDLIDQALIVHDPVSGKEVMRYGGDFDDRPSDYEFSGNGIVFADRTEKPAMQEVKYFYGKYREV
ncbi:MAG: beta-galactosidase [Lachnospiraceae bacterium]|nr:beta-galactosidase [Lachnospiraceae bacterium]